MKSKEIFKIAPPGDDPFFADKVERFTTSIKADILFTSIRIVLRQNIGPRKITRLQKTVTRTKKG